MSKKTSGASEECKERDAATLKVIGFLHLEYLLMQSTNYVDILLADGHPVKGKSAKRFRLIRKKRRETNVVVLDSRLTYTNFHSFTHFEQIKIHVTASCLEEDTAPSTNPFRPFPDEAIKQDFQEQGFLDSERFNNVSESIFQASVNGLSSNESIFSNGKESKSSQGNIAYSVSSNTSIEEPFQTLSLTEAIQYSTTPQSQSNRPNQGTRKKKNSDQQAFPDIKVLLRENQLLKEKLVQVELRKKEIVAVNHLWDQEYNTLKDKYERLNQENTTLKNDIKVMQEGHKKEISEKNFKIDRLSEKLKNLFNSIEDTEDNSLDHMEHLNETNINESRPQKSNSQSENDEKFEENAKIENLLSEERKERKLILQREQAAQNCMKELNVKCQYLQELCQHESQQKVFLQSELQRLRTIISRYEQASANEIPKLATQNNGFANLQEENENNILKQQLRVFMDDFQCEQNEKKNLILEKEKITEELQILKEKNSHLETQLKIYEQDFHQEREKRIDLMRKNRLMPPTSRTGDTFISTSRGEYTPNSMLPNTPNVYRSEDTQQKYKEYCQLIVERQLLGDRISELESQGISRYNGRNPDSSASSTYSNSHSRGRGNSQLQQPPLPHSLPTPPYIENDLFRDNWIHAAQYSGESRAPSEYSVRLR